MPFAPGLASILAVASPPPILPLMASNVSDWPSLLTIPLTGCNSLPPGSSAAQRLERDLAAPALHQPRAERLGGIMSGRADRQRKGRRQRELVEADLALDVFFVAQA